MKILFEKRKAATKRREGLIPGILYGPGIGNNVVMEVNSKEFVRIYGTAGESSLINLESTDDSQKYLVLINDVQRDPISGEITHIDFYQPNLEEKVEVTVPLRFIGLAPAIKELGGTLVKNFLELDVKALPQELPKDIEVNVDGLSTFDDVITIADLKVPMGVDIIKEPGEIVALVTPIDVEEELKPIEEDVEKVAKVEKKEKDKFDEEEEK